MIFKNIESKVLMSSTFWSNTIWYVVLGILTLIELIYVTIRANRRSLMFAFFITVLGITLNFESTILIYLKSYTYYPMIIKNSSNPFNDVLVGNLFSQFSVSATILLVTVLDLKYYWYFVFVLIYGAVEEYFLFLGIYSHNWYRTWMTMVLLPVAFYGAKKMYAKIIQGIKPIFYYLYIYLGLFPLNMITIMWFFQLSGYLDFSTTFLRDPIDSRYVILLLYFQLHSIPLMFIYFSRLGYGWKVLTILVLYAIFYTCYKLNLIWIKDGWFLLVSTLNIFWMYLSIFLLDRLYGRPINNL